ncbi:Protein arginine N-methyltransferase 3 [Trichoplax sp. H2]|nr:Protein arginine N-methyltransferase 3 [Trichoplax sp. H2]|eukprot:RDD38556.1 Protein arginine N-methyltransferase 3 [Trichoplax sp. H2]
MDEVESPSLTEVIIYIILQPGQFVDDESLDDDEDWEDWCEDGNDVEEVLCLFCSEKFHSVEKLIHHLKEYHNFNLETVANRYGFDVYGRIKLINYIRLTHPLPNFWENISDSIPWESENFLKPVISDDLLLRYVIDMEDTFESGAIDADMEGDELQNQRLQEKRLAESENRAYMAECTLTELRNELENARLLRSTLREILLDTTDAKEDAKEDELRFCSSDDAYFNSYSGTQIHEEMLKDRIRTEAYMNFILNNPALFRDKIVLDVGCGTGILSMFAAKAGCRHVYAIDQSDIINYARDIVMENQLENKITLIKGKVEDVKLPIEKVDVIISEWMGYCLLFESMLDSVIFAREKWLTVDGQVYPNSCSLNAVAINDKIMHDKSIEFWDNVYGFKMSCLKSTVLDDADIAVVKSETIISDICCLKILDVSSVKVDELNFQCPISLKINQAGCITALVVYFDTFFSKTESFSTGPCAPATHWGQTIFHLRDRLNVEKGEQIFGQFSCMKNKENHRNLNVNIVLESSINKNTFKLQQVYYLR